MNANYYKYTLRFKIPSGTSRGVLTQKETFFIVIKHQRQRGIGECSLLRRLSIDDVADYEEKLKWVCNHIHLGKDELLKHLIFYPSIQFGIEMAFLSLHSDNDFILFPSAFTESKQGIITNGLIWMGNVDFMKKQIKEKIRLGFRCIKMKISAINFEKEYSILRELRKDLPADKIEIRVDVNGSLTCEEALDKLKMLSALQIHSIEQPIKQGNIEQMKKLCENTPLPIALDEELIGIFLLEEKRKLLQKIKPQYIILKPSLIGGIRGSEEWIQLAKEYNIGWWITSALESNIGLNAIAQWTHTLSNPMPQGLGTGGLYINNIPSALELKGEKLFYNHFNGWDTKFLF